MRLELLHQIYNAGVIGAGGAGFPTHKKLVSAPYLIINAAECEPLLHTDITMTNLHATEIVATLNLLKETIGFEHVVIGIKKKHHAEITKLEQAIASSHSDVRLHLLENIYPMGDEQVLVYEILGKTVPPGGIPIEVGAVVQNVTTIINIAHALLGIPVTNKVVTVTGEVASPCLVEFPIGASVKDCIDAAGGTHLQDYVVILGGPMMGRMINGKHSEKTFLSKTDGGIIVLPSQHPLPMFKKISLEHIYNRAKAACIQCSFCTDLCPRYLIGHQMRPHRVMRSVSTGATVTDLLDALLCCECGICELYSCPMGLSPRKVNMDIKQRLRSAGVKITDKSIHPEYTKARDFRQLPQERLIYRLDLAAYQHGHLELRAIAPAQVTVPLRQGIGKMATPCVQVGDVVQVGDLVGTVPFEELGSQVHASINGTVTAIATGVTIAAGRGTV